MGGHRPIRVVLADDADAVLVELAAILNGVDDIEVVATVGDGTALLSAVADTTPDVVLVDVRMPGLDGLDSLRAMADDTVNDTRPYRAVLTSFDLDEYVDAALAAGAHGFLLKDIGPHELIRAVRDLAAGGAVIDPRVAVRLLPRLRHTHVRENDIELSERERAVLLRIGEGASNSAIGSSLGISESTVKGYVTRLLAKLGAQNRVQAALIAQRWQD